MQKKPLLLQLFLSYLWIIVIVVVGIGVYGTYSTQDFYLTRTADELHVRAKLGSHRVIELLQDGQPDAVDALCKTWGKDATTRFTVVLPDGKVVGDTEEDPVRMVNHRDRPEVLEALAGRVGRATRYSKTTEEDRMYIAIAVPAEGPLLAVVRASIPVTEINTALSAIQQKIFVVSLLAFILVAAATLLWMARRVSGPLNRMRDAVEKSAQGDMPYPFPEGDSEELSELADALKQMTDKLASRIRASRPPDSGA